MNMFNLFDSTVANFWFQTSSTTWEALERELSKLDESVERKKAINSHHSKIQNSFSQQKGNYARELLYDLAIISAIHSFS